jgi:hypothetical protein
LTRKKKVVYSKKVPNFTLIGQQGLFFVKNSPQNNLLTNEPISYKHYTGRFSSASEKLRNFKNISRFVLGRQSGNFSEKSSPLNNFSTVQPIFTSNTLIDSAKQWEQTEITKGAIFVEKSPLE